MNMSKKRLSVAMMAASLLAAGMSVPDHVAKMFFPKAPRRRSWHRPHQGAREMARRRGGMDWERMKDADRARRGLPGKEG